MATLHFSQEKIPSRMPTPEWQAKIDQFTEKINSQSKIIKIVPREGEATSEGDEKGSVHRVTFDVRMILPEDPFINKEQYDRGEAYVHVSDAFHEALDSVGKEIFGREPQSNNTGSVFWFYDYQRSQ